MAARRVVIAGGMGSKRCEAQSGHSAPCVPEGTAQLGPRGGHRHLSQPTRSPVRFLCQHLLPTPPQASLHRLSLRSGGHLLAWVPSGYCLGHSCGPLLGFSAIIPGSRGPGRGSRAPGPAMNTWSGCGASLRGPNPRLWRLGLRGRGGWLRFPQRGSKSLPAPTVTRATVGGGAALQERRGRAWIGFAGARGGVARGLLLKMAPSQPTAGASGRARRSSAGVAVRVGLTGPSRTRRQVDSAWSSTLPSRAPRARIESPSPCPEPSLGPTGQAGGARLGHLCAPVLSWPQGNLVAFSIRWTRRVGCSTPSGLGYGVLAGPVAMGSGEAVLPLLCGPVWPLALHELAASPDKEPRALGCPTSGRVGLLSLGSHGIASLLANSEARPVTVPVAPAVWDSQS